MNMTRGQTMTSTQAVFHQRNASPAPTEHWMQKDLSQAEVLLTKITLGNVLPPKVCRADPMVLEPRRLATAAEAVIRGSIA